MTKTFNLEKFRQLRSEAKIFNNDWIYDIHFEDDILTYSAAFEEGFSIGTCDIEPSICPCKTCIKHRKLRRLLLECISNEH